MAWDSFEFLRKHSESVEYKITTKRYGSITLKDFPENDYFETVLSFMAKQEPTRKRNFSITRGF